MRTFLQDLTLLAAVSAAGAFALTYATPSVRWAAPPDPKPPQTLAAPRHAPISLSALSPGEEIRVRFASRGCYHDVEQDFVFTPTSDGNVALTHTVRRANLLEGWLLVAPSRLSGPQLAELDALLAYFRAFYPLPDGRYCRAQETVEIALYRQDHEVAMERFSGTCGSPDEKALTFGRLARMTRRIAEPPQN
jgi:hypothetical protein